MKIVFGGDISFNYMSQFEGKRKAEEAMAEAAEVFATADYSMLNLENVLGNEDDGVPIIKSGPNLISEEGFVEYIHVLKPNIVGLANNHSMDYGEEILFHTMDMLVDSGYICVGAGKNLDEAYKPVEISSGGVKVQIIAVCENEFGIAGENAPGTAGYRLGKICAAISLAKSRGAKPIIYFHGGNERNPFPSPGKIELYRHFIDMGAEAVIAMHTHCPQGYEYYKEKPIVYSMGNFFFPSDKLALNRSWQYGYLSELEIFDSDIRLSIYPYKFDFDKLTMLRGDEKAAFMKYMECLNAPLRDLVQIQNYFDSWCLMNDDIEYLKDYRSEYVADGYAREVRFIRNLFSCEAHNELLKNKFLMMYEQRVERAKAGMNQIKRLQNMECI